MNRKITLAFTLSLMATMWAIGGCVGYAGSVNGGGSDPSSTAGMMSPTPAALNLGTVAVGQNSSQTVAVKNTGNATVVLSSLKSSNAVFAASGPTFPQNLAAGQSVSFSVAFAPQAAGSATGTVTLMSNASNSPTNIAVAGMGSASNAGVMSANPASVSLGNVTVGSNTSQAVTLTNTGGTTVALSSLNSSSAAFVTSGLSLPMNVGAGQSASFEVTFAPQSAGAANGTISVASDASNSPTAIAVSGTGVAVAQAPSISQQPASATVTAGQTATFSVTATGAAPLSYQWQKNGAAISGATSASYTTPATSASDSGSKFGVTASNSAGTVTSSAATLTVNAATSILNSSTSSLSFGSVNVGSNSAQSVTFNNAGNSNVTVSGVTVSGAGFNATGISTGQVVAPGNSATLTVTFAPGTSGAANGTVTVASNATNSPASISLSGTGAAQTSSAPVGAPTCGKNNDMAVHVPTDWTTFVPPPKGQSYVDSTFGCTVVRITDSSNDDYSGSYYLPITHGYATVSPFNANDTYLMLSDGWNRHFVTDLTGNSIVSIANMPQAYNDGWFYWDATNPNVFYYTNGNSMMSGTIQGSSVTTATVHQFAEYAEVNFMDETDISQDGAHAVLIGGDTTGNSPENVFDYDFANNVKGPVYTTTTCTGSVNVVNNNCLHKMIQAPDNNVLIDFASDGTAAEQGVRLWTGLSPLPHVQDFTNHIDSGEDMSGSSVFIELGNTTTVEGFTNPCPSGWGLDVRQIYNTASSVCLVDIDYNGQIASWHVGYRGNPQQPWAGISFFDNRTPSPEWFDSSTNYTAPSASNWMLFEDEIDSVRIDANNNSTYVYRLARAYSRSVEDFDGTPRAAISRDGKYIAFDSNMAYAHTGCPANFQTSTNCTDVYIIKIH